MSTFTLSDMERLGALQDAERTFQMDEETFRVFYEATARPLWLYLSRVTGDPRQAEDLLQEAYYRLLRAAVHFDSDDHRRFYLFRVATNLAHDHRRRTRAGGPVEERDEALLARTAAHDGTAAQVESQIDVSHAMRRLKPRERALLWLAYAQGWSHAEIAETLGLRKASLKALLWRARRRLVRLMQQGGATGDRR
jgi:RNA polymerase sigma-70 factor (ECF subfamily)